MKSCLTYSVHRPFPRELWCVLGIGRSPGLSSIPFTPSRTRQWYMQKIPKLQLRDSDGIAPFFPFKLTFVCTNSYTIYLVHL